MDIYSHLVDEGRGRVASRMNDALAEVGENSVATSVATKRASGARKDRCESLC
jgi:hypothetical protein